MGKRESSDDFYRVPKGIRRQHERSDEQKMVIAGQDVANAVEEKCFKQRSTCLSDLAIHKGNNGDGHDK